MRCYAQQHPCDCGIGLRARTVYTCILATQEGEILLPLDVKASPEAWLTLTASVREDVVVAVAWIFPWSWLADLCARAGGIIRHNFLLRDTLDIMRR